MIVEGYLEVRTKSKYGYFKILNNQIIATVVEDDIAFGPENMGLEREKIKDRIEFALKSLHIEHCAKCHRICYQVGKNN